MKRIVILVLLLVVHLGLLVNLNFTAWPEMLSFSFMVDKGFLIYKDFHHVYQPLLTYVLTLVYNLFGFSVDVLKVFTWVLVVANDILIYLIVKKFTGKNTLAFASLALYVFIQPVFEGNLLWFDLALVTPLLISIYLFASWLVGGGKMKLFWMGLFISLGFLIKQQAALIFLPFIIYLIIKKIKLSEFGYFSMGALTPVFISLIVLLRFGVLSDYLFWTLKLPLIWLPKISGYGVMPTLREWEILILLVLVPVAGIVGSIRDLSKVGVAIFLFSIFILEVISAFPRFSLFHLQPAIAIYSLLFGMLLKEMSIWSMIMSLFISASVGLYRWRFVSKEFGHNVRFYDQETINLANYVHSSVSSDEKIYLMGPNALVYVFSDRIPPKPWIENYVWHFEIPGLQERLISAFESDPPHIILWTTPRSGDWNSLSTYQPKKIVEWIELNYYKDGQVESGIGIWRKK
jgi:hypothetical protein